MPDFKEEQERIQAGVVEGGSAKRMQRSREARGRQERELVVREENERLSRERQKVGEEEDLRLRREERESKELEETLRKYKEEDARNEFQQYISSYGKNEEEQIYEQLDSYNQEAYNMAGQEQKTKLFTNLKSTSKISGSEWEDQKEADLLQGGRNHDDDKLNVSLSCLGRSAKSTEDDIDDIYMKKRDLLMKRPAWDVDKKSYIAFERPELLSEQSPQENLYPAGWQSTCSTSSTGSEYLEKNLYSVAEKAQFPTERSRDEQKRMPTTNEESQYFLPAGFAPGSHYLEMQSRGSEHQDSVGAGETYEEAFEKQLEEEEVLASYDKSPAKHLVADPPPFIGPLLPSSPSSYFHPMMPAPPRTPARQAASSGPHKRALSAPAATIVKQYICEHLANGL